jgi:hypothetical protein
MNPLDEGGPHLVATPAQRDPSAAMTRAYADLVTGVLDARADLASERFDAEVAAAEAEGRIDARTARVLRWWQRESLRALVEHTRTALPPALAALDQAHVDAARGAGDAAEAWARAVGDSLAPEAPSAPAPEPSVAAPYDLRERRRRLLVAGLSPVPREE